MTAGNDLQTITGYMEWSNDVFFNAVEQLAPEELYKERKMLFGSIISLLNHCYNMGLVWRSHLIGEPHGFQSRIPSDECAFPELRDQQKIVDLWYRQYVRSISVSTAKKKIAFNFIGGGSGSMSPEEILLHLVNHNSYHRGHIEGVFYQMDIEPPTTDFPVYLRHRCS